MHTIAVFVYGTLKAHSVRLRAMREEAQSVDRADLLHYRVTVVGTYPTLEKAPGMLTHGDLLDVTPEDLKRLIDWESRYKLIDVVLTDGTDAKTFILK